MRGGRIPFLDRHAARLAAALSELGMPAPSEHLVALVAKHVSTEEAIVRVEVRDGRATVTSLEARLIEPPRCSDSGHCH